MHWVYLTWFAVIVGVLGSVTISAVTQMMDWDVDRFLNGLRSASQAWTQKWAHAWRMERNKEGEIAA